MSEEFEEISHGGGKLTIIVTTEQGRRAYQTRYERARPQNLRVTGVWALPQGIPVGSVRFGGVRTEPGEQAHPFPFPTYQVLLMSDSEAEFGHNCPRCNGYWRSGAFPNVCPYCALEVPSHEFLSDAQRRFVREFCSRLRSALASDTDQEIVIDMDEVADAVGKDAEKPAFYVSERSQQHKFNCQACGQFNDILGRFGFCSSCGTRNDVAIFRDSIISVIRGRLNAGSAPENAVRDAVAGFDSLAAQYGKTLAHLVPLTDRRSKRLLERRYHDAARVSTTFKECFDIDIRSGIKEDDWSFVVRMFHRRHVYEHPGGEVDQRYVDESGDKEVVPKQHIHETKDSAHRLLNVLLRMAQNLHDGFHELIPPVAAPIAVYEKAKASL